MSRFTRTVNLYPTGTLIVGVIGLPDGIWAFGAMPVHQFVTVAERCLTLVGERDIAGSRPRTIV